MPGYEDPDTLRLFLLVSVHEGQRAVCRSLGGKDSVIVFVVLGTGSKVAACNKDLYGCRYGDQNQDYG